MIGECNAWFPIGARPIQWRLNRVISVPVGSSLAGPGSGEEVTCMSSATNFRGDFNDRSVGDDSWC